MKLHIHKVTIPADAGTGWNAVQERLESAAEEVRLLAMADKRQGIRATGTMLLQWRSVPRCPTE